METKKHVLLFTLIHACIGASVVMVKNESLVISTERQQREQRSGGFPKFPPMYVSSNTIVDTHMSRDTYYTARECGTRVINFDPINDLMRKGKIVGGTTVSIR